MTTVLTDSCKDSCAGLKLVLDWSFQHAPIVPCWQLIIRILTGKECRKNSVASAKYVGQSKYFSIPKIDGQCHALTDFSPRKHLLNRGGEA